jgi:hypothetical protein
MKTNDNLDDTQLNVLARMLINKSDEELKMFNLKGENLKKFNLFREEIAKEQAGYTGQNVMHKTPADYAVQTQKWRDALKISIYGSYDERVKLANEAIESFQYENPELYAEFMSAARGFADPHAIKWSGGGIDMNMLELENKERNAPVVPHLSGHVHDEGRYIALALSTADGVLEVAMAHAFETGDITIGKIISAQEKKEWSYTVTCVDYDANAKSIDSFLKQTNNNDDKTIVNVNSDYVTSSQHTHLAYRKKGTCKIELNFERSGVNNVSESDSPQYDDGKERRQAHYSV